MKSLVCRQGRPVQTDQTILLDTIVESQCQQNKIFIHKEQCVGVVRVSVFLCVYVCLSVHVLCVLVNL